MFKIVIIEDEPSAMRHLRSIIEGKCEGFEIVAEAENGLEGLEKIRELLPDLVITDIKMALMDGIELVECVKKEMPWIRSVIVSGYQDFEYAKSAIRSGVVDYLLKPVNPTQIKTLLQDLYKKITREYYEKRMILAKRALMGIGCEEWMISKYLPGSLYEAAVLRKNGVPSRFSKQQNTAHGGILIETDTAPGIDGQEGVLVLQGRDEQELVFLQITTEKQKAGLIGIVSDVASKITGGYHTSVFSQGGFSLSDFGKVLQSLYRALDHNIVIGVSQNLGNTYNEKAANERRLKLEDAFSNKLGYFMSNAMYGDLKKELEKLVDKWDKEKYTSLYIENQLRAILLQIEKNAVAAGGKDYDDVEFMLEEAMFYSYSFEELFKNIWDIVEKIVKNVDKKNQKVDTEEFIDSILEHTRKNLQEPITLQSICSVFGISQTYLSRLLRKYKNTTFNEYLTLARIEKAKQLIIDNPQLPLKEIAQLVGYNDPFYFSRVFRLVTGMPPSEYAGLSHKNDGE